MGVFTGISNIASSGISAAAGTAATAMTNAANKDIAQMNNAFNEKMFNKQIGYNKEMYQQQLGDQWQFYNDAKQNQWDMFEATNEYNSASAQRERLEAAGLNPNLMMSGGNAGVATSTSGTSGSAPSGQGVNPPTAAPYSADYSGLADAVGSAIDTYTQLSLAKSQRGKMNAEENNLRIEGKYKAASMIADIESKMQNTKSQAAKTAMEQLLVGVQKDLMAAQTDKVKGETTYNAILARGAAIDNLSKSEMLKVLPQQLQNQLMQQTADIAVRWAQRDLTKKQVEHEIEKIANTIANTDATQVQTNGNIQQQQYFSDTAKIQKNKLIAEMRKSIFDVKPFGESNRFSPAFNSLYQMYDLYDADKKGKDYLFDYE